MAAQANSVKKIMDLDVDQATGRIVMNIRITVDGTPARNAFVGGKADRPVGSGFTDHPAVTAGAIHETVGCFVTELIKVAAKG